MTATYELGQKILDDLAESSEPPLKGSYRWMSVDQIDRLERRIQRNRLRSSDDDGELLSFPRLPQGNLSGAEQAASIVPPVSLDSILSTHPGSRGEEGRDVSEYGRAGFDEEPREAGRPAQTVECAAEGRLVIDPTLVSWLKGLLAAVLGNALESTFDFAVLLLVAASLFRREIARLLWRPTDTRDE
jgi:hypothetical protein